MINHKERGHSPIGASSAHRWFACPGSIKLIEQVGVHSESKYAAEGTAAHELLEKCLVENLNPYDLIGTYQGEFQIDDEMAGAVNVCIEYVESKLKEDSDIHVEQKFQLKEHDQLYGTNDICIVDHFEKITIIDYKHGKGIAVEAMGNKQLMYYALGALQLTECVDEIELVIVQPRADHPDGPIRSHTISPKILEQFRADLISKVEEVYSDNAVLMAGDHCRFCPAKANCPSLRDKSLAVAKQKFSDVEAGTINLPEPNTLTPEQISKILDSEALLKDWLQGIRDHAYSHLESGKEIPGYCFKKGRKKRSWKDEKEVEKHFEMFGDDLYERKILSPAKLEKVVGKAEVAQFVHEEYGAKILSKDNGKGQKIAPVIDAFTEVN